jgi:hypothetical protein
MPAPTIAALLAGDITIEEVWAGILTAALAGTGVTAAIAFSAGTKSSPYVDVMFEDTNRADRELSFPVPGSNPPRSVKYHPVTMGTLLTTVNTVRGVDSDQQKLIIGTVRACAEDFAALFNTDVLPFHGINLFKEVGKKQYVDTENRLDKTELRHRLHFNWRMEALQAALAATA